MKKLGFYCQHLLGIGHLTRSLAICEGLINDFQVSFIQGGEDIGRSIDHGNIQFHFLSPLRMNESDSSLYSPNLDLEECWSLRQQQINKLSEEAYDALIVELYPFGRKKFKTEVHYLIDRVKEKNPHCKIICSLRDILVEKPDWEKRQEKIIKVVEEKFDWVFVHSDEKFVPLELSFSKANKISDKMIYTGYISEPLQGVEKEVSREGVLVSLGGGIVGDELIYSLLPIAEELNDISWSFILSPNMNPKVKAALEKSRSDNIKVLEFSKNYQQLLSRHQLSISMGGYNTVMNLLKTKTLAIVYPYQRSSEQLTRTKMLANKKLLVEIGPQDLEPEALRKIVQNSLNSSSKTAESIDLDGVSNTNLQLQKILS